MKSLFNGCSVLVFLVAVLFAGIGSADAVESVDFSQEHWYVGGGVNHNTLSNHDGAFGVQGFAGLDLPYTFHRQVTTHAEIGVLRTGDFDRKNSSRTFDHVGLWTAGLLKFHVNDQFRALARLGFDFGDDDGPMFGAGAEVDLASQWFLRGEFVARDDINSSQLNLGFHF